MDPSCEGLLSFTKRLTRAPLASPYTFAGAWTDYALLVALLGLWLCTIFDCFVVGVVTVLASHDGLKRLYVILQDKDLRLDKSSTSPSVFG